jgi:hypothetical protein
MISTGIDVVSFLKEQHDQIRHHFALVNGSAGEERQRAFVALRRLLAVHETAEEEIVHPAARHALENGAALVEARLGEEREAKEVLAQLEKLDVSSPEFATLLSRLERSVLVHAQAEEREEFDKLAAVLDQRQLESMRKAAEFAEKVAPTRPHPGVESAAANMLAGPFAAMIDRTRDALSGKAR